MTMCLCVGHPCRCGADGGRPVPSFAEWFGKPYADPFHAGAAVAFGLMGMAEAIRAAHPMILRDADWHLEEDERAF